MIKFYKRSKINKHVYAEEIKNVHIKVGDITIFNARSKGNIYMGNSAHGLEGGNFNYMMFEKAIEDFYNKNL